MNKLKITKNQLSNNVGAHCMRPEGITLIALIITIIVLLILVAVTLAMVMGNNGIIAKAQLAKDRTNASQVEEENQLKDFENKIDGGLQNRGITPSGTIDITQNGDYNVTNYANANVNVVPDIEYISASNRDETEDLSYTWTATKDAKAFVTIFATPGNNGSNTIPWCKKNGTDITMSYESRYTSAGTLGITINYVFDIKENDVITFGAESTGNWGRVGHMFWIQY